MMESFSRSTTANSDINTKNDNSWKTMGDIISSTINSIPDDKYEAPITAVEVSFVIHSDWNGYFSTDTRLVIKGASTTAQHYNTGKFSGNKRRTYKFLINDKDFTIGYLKYNPTQLKLQFKAYRASGQGTLKVYCKSQTVNITYYIGDIPISFDSPANEEQFKQYTDKINIQLSKKSNDNNNYTLQIINTKTSEEIYSEGISSNDFNDNIYNKLIGPYNTSQTLTLKCLNSNNVSVANCQIEIIKNDIFAISSVINRYDKNNNEYELAFDGAWVKLDINITTLAESFLNKPMVFTLAVGNEKEKIYIEKENLIKNFKITNKSYFNFPSDSNYTVSLSAKEAQTDNDGDPIFPEDSTIPEEIDVDLFTQDIQIPTAKPILNVYEGGVAIGQFSTGTSESPKFECAYPAIFKYFEDEKECGIWIDGSIIYRKIIIFGAVPFNNMRKKPMGINFDDIKDLISFHGGCLRGSGVWTTLDCSAISVTSNISIWIKKYNYEEDYPHLFDQTILPEENEALVCIGTGNVTTGSIQRGILIAEYTKNVNVETETEPET